MVVGTSDFSPSTVDSFMVRVNAIDSVYPLLTLSHSHNNDQNKVTQNVRPSQAYRSQGDF